MDIEGQHELLGKSFIAVPYEPTRGARGGIDGSTEANLLKSMIYYPKKSRQLESRPTTTEKREGGKPPETEDQSSAPVGASGYDPSRDGLFIPSVSLQVSKKETGWKKDWKTFDARKRMEESLKATRLAIEGEIVDTEHTAPKTIPNTSKPNWKVLQWPRDRMKEAEKNNRDPKPLVRFVEPKIGLPDVGMSGLVSSSFLNYDKDISSVPPLPETALDHIQSWMEKNAGRLDPYDPDNIRLTELLNKLRTRLDAGSIGEKEKRLSETKEEKTEADGETKDGDKGEKASADKPPTYMETQKKEFLISQGKSSISFGSLEQMMNSPRIKMLILRNKGVPHLRNVPVPLNEREVPVGFLTTNLSITGHGDVSSGVRGLESRREKALEILREVGQKLLLQSQDRIDRPSTLEDLVIERETSGIEFALDFFTGTIRRRPLHPVRKERKKVTLSSITSGVVQGENQPSDSSRSEVKLVISVMHATNVPVRIWTPDEEERSRLDRHSSASRRTSSHPRRRPSSLDISTHEEGASRVNPFVEVVFQGQVIRTSTAEGPHPTWNETLEMGIRPPQVGGMETQITADWSPSSMSQVKESIFLNLYDEVILSSPEVGEEETLRKGDQSPSRTSISSWTSVSSTPRVERRWLGSLSIPFSTLYINGRIEGTFGVRAPISLLGYDYEKGPIPTVTVHHPTSSQLTRSRSEASDSSSEQTLVTLFVTTDPLLSRPTEEGISLKCDSEELETILSICRDWEKEVKECIGSTGSKRRVKALTVDLSGKWVVVTRFLSPIRPPDLGLSSADTSTLNMEDVMRRLARFVSLIPSIPDYSTTGGVLSDVWLSCDQFLNLLVGDEEEHAILLCNFFLFLGRRAGLVLGYGLPEGPTSYVIVWEYSVDEVILWNPVTGSRYSTRDPFIPLTSVGCIITSDNVYANIGPHEHPTRIRFDFRATSEWRPLFSKKTPLPSDKSLPTIQPESIDYRPVDNKEAKSLQERMESFLKSCLIRWRTTRHYKTFFNRTVTQKIRKLLPKLEKQLQASRTLTATTSRSSTKGSGGGGGPDPLKSLHDLQSNYRMTGFPLNLPFTEGGRVAEVLYSTGVHMTGDSPGPGGSGVEFVLAVYIHPYPCSVLSLWVYVASLTTPGK